MLSSVISKSDCAACRFCCSFRRQSLWETPLFDPQTAEKLKKLYPEACFRQRGDAFTIYLGDRYETDDPEEEALCPFNCGGCVLDNATKPFDCSIWPLRIMRVEGKLAICLTPTCPVISEKPPAIMKELANSEVGDRIGEYAKTHTFIIKEYREGFPILRYLV